ncbi:MAG: hypothetical protein BWY82_01774 [Verrucomicrobia bacterium ADurb.Bin474]|nr:MAG: hypothetical protein BWY82_01774 [Verrucomicrobia bacterium ADurb.Bin474]
MLCRDSRLLKLDHHQRQPIHKTHQIRPTGIKCPHHRQLTDQQKFIVLGTLPVDHPKPLRFLPSMLPRIHFIFITPSAFGRGLG